MQANEFCKWMNIIQKKYYLLLQLLLSKLLNIRLWRCWVLGNRKMNNGTNMKIYKPCPKVICPFLVFFFLLQSSSVLPAFVAQTPSILLKVYPSQTEAFFWFLELLQFQSWMLSTLVIILRKCISVRITVIDQEYWFI